jgi:hypothetical protein
MYFETFSMQIDREIMYWEFPDYRLSKIAKTVKPKMKYQ